VAIDTMVRTLPELYQTIIVGQMKKMRSKQIARRKSAVNEKQTQSA
jgi:hypothetical protein